MFSNTSSKVAQQMSLYLLALEILVGGNVVEGSHSPCIAILFIVSHLYIISFFRKTDFRKTFLKTDYFENVYGKRIRVLPKTVLLTIERDRFDDFKNLIS